MCKVFLRLESHQLCAIQCPSEELSLMSVPSNIPWFIYVRLSLKHIYLNAFYWMLCIWYFSGISLGLLCKYLICMQQATKGCIRSLLPKPGAMNLVLKLFKRALRASEIKSVSGFQARGICEWQRLWCDFWVFSGLGLLFWLRYGSPKRDKY